MSKKRASSFKSNAFLDVVITTSGRYDMLRKCLDALYREAEKTPLNIILVDNASHPDDRHQNEDVFIKREGSQVCGFMTKRLTQEEGFPASNNEGARMGRSPYIMFLNDDVELHDGAIQKVMETFQDKTIGVVGIKLMFPPTSTSNIRPANRVQHVGLSFNIQGMIFHPLLGWSPTNPKTCLNRDVVGVTGACLTIPRNIFTNVRGFSPEYGLGTWEDVDLCFKVRSIGLRAYVNAQATGYHYTGATQEKKGRGYPVQQNRLIFQAKWAPTGLMAWTEIDFW